MGGELMYYIEVIDGYCTGAWATTKQQWTNMEIEEMPNDSLVFYRVENNKLILDENKKRKVINQRENEKIKFELEKYLRETDWYVTRFIETQKPIPNDILQKRQEARKQISNMLF